MTPMWVILYVDIWEPSPNKSKIWRQFQPPKSSDFVISLHDTRILRILVEDEEKESINEGKGKEFRVIIC